VAPLTDKRDAMEGGGIRLRRQFFTETNYKNTSVKFKFFLISSQKSSKIYKVKSKKDNIVIQKNP
jgi:hypothetical protein